MVRGVNEILYTNTTTILVIRERFFRIELFKRFWWTWSLLGVCEIMVVVVKISKTGKLLCIKEISDKYRETPYKWDNYE